MFGSVIKDKVVSNLNSSFVVTIHLSGRKNRSNYNKSTNISHICNMSKSLLIIHTMQVNKSNLMNKFTIYLKEDTKDKVRVLG